VNLTKGDEVNQVLLQLPEFVAFLNGVHTWQSWALGIRGPGFPALTYSTSGVRANPVSSIEGGREEGRGSNDA